MIPAPGTHKERKSEAAQDTAVYAVWGLKQRGLVIHGDNLKD